MRRRLPQLVCGFFGLLLFVLHFVTGERAGQIYASVMKDYYQIIYAFALLVGAASFVRYNLKSVARGEERPYRIAALGGLVLMPVLALGWGIGGDSPFLWIFDNVQVPMQATVFALLAFYVASASLRGFRARSLPATVLLLAALLTLLSRSDLGGWVSDNVTPVADWVRHNPAMSARRGILIGIGLGSLTTSLRVILGIERTWLGGGK